MWFTENSQQLHFHAAWNECGRKLKSLMWMWSIMNRSQMNRSQMNRSQLSALRRSQKLYVKKHYDTRHMNRCEQNKGTVREAIGRFEMRTREIVWMRNSTKTIFPVLKTPQQSFFHISGNYFRVLNINVSCVSWQRNGEDIGNSASL